MSQLRLLLLLCEHWNYFRGNVGKLGRGEVHISFSEHTDTILN